jgi:glycosyltransferase involved in cell wall biosynthesis
MKGKSAKYGSNLSDMGLRDHRYLLFVGSLTKREGIHYLIEAFKQLEDTAKTPNNFKLAIVANGNEADDEDYEKYLHLISEKRSNIIFFCVRSKTSIKQLLSHAYLYVQPSEKELSQGALLEAMAFGTAPLVSDLKDHLEIIGNDGFSFKTKSVLDLRDRLAYLLSRQDEVSLMGERAKKLARKQSSEKGVLDDKADIGKKIISEKYNKSLWNWKNLLKKSQ